MTKRRRDISTIIDQDLSGSGSSPIQERVYMQPHHVTTAIKASSPDISIEILSFCTHEKLMRNSLQCLVAQRNSIRGSLCLSVGLCVGPSIRHAFLKQGRIHNSISRVWVGRTNGRTDGFINRPTE